MIYKFGPGKGGPGKSTTGFNLAVALALEFMRQAWREILHAGLGSNQQEEQQSALVERIVTSLMAVQLTQQRTKQNIIQILLRHKVPEQIILAITDELEEVALYAEVLLVEIDPQLNSRKALDVPREEGERTVHDVLLNPQFGIDYAIRHSRFGVDILPGAKTLSDLELDLGGGTSIRREYRLDDALRRARGSDQYPIKQQAIERYRVILIDPPPTLAMLGLNSMVACDKALIVIDMGDFANDAIEQYVERLQLVKDQISVDHPVVLGGIICNRYYKQEGYYEQCKASEDFVRKHYGDLVFKTIIPQNSKIFNSPTHRVPVQYNDPSSSTTRVAIGAYMGLAQELIRRDAL